MDLLAYGAPQVQAIRVQVHALRQGRMNLHNGVLILPEQGFDVAHLFPGGCPAFGRNGYADMLPSLIAHGNAEKVSALFGLLPGNEEGAVVTMTGSGPDDLILDAVLLRYFEHMIDDVVLNNPGGRHRPGL